MTDNLKPVMELEELQEYINTEFPQPNLNGPFFFIEFIENGKAHMRLEADPVIHTRPGGTISGPTMFGLADYAAFAVILAHIGPKGLSVTTNLNINFMRKPVPPTLIATAEIMKLGKRLAVVDVAIRKPEEKELVAHATATYSIAP